MFEGLSHLFSMERPRLEILRDVGDILIVAFILYRVLMVLRGTRAMQIGLGLLSFGFLYILAKYAELATLQSLLSYMAASAILIIVVVFQNDIRRALIRLGSKAWFSRAHDAREQLIEEVVAAATELARHRMGALICLERDANVMEFVKNDGIELDCKVSRELLVALFIPESKNKAHDGAVLIRDLRIDRAGLFFPMPDTTKVADPTLGSRHRAAIGLTEETDAVVVAVSEERGSITLFFPNGMAPKLDGASLKAALVDLLGGAAAENEKTLVSRLMSGLRGEARPEPDATRVPVTERSAKSSAKPSSGKPGNAKPSSAKPSVATPGGVKPGAKSAAAKATSKPATAKAKSAKTKSASGVSSSRSPASQSAPRQSSPSAVKSAAAKQARSTSSSGRFAAMNKDSAPRDEDDRRTPAPRLSVPMPSPRERLNLTSEESPPPPSVRVSKPMTPTDLPATILGGDES